MITCDLRLFISSRFAFRLRMRFRGRQLSRAESGRKPPYSLLPQPELNFCRMDEAAGPLNLISTSARIADT